MGNKTFDFAMLNCAHRNHTIHSILFSVINATTSLSGTFLNLTFIITVLKNKFLQTIPNVILFGLALNDLFMASFVMLITVYVTANLVTDKVSCKLFLYNIFLMHSSMNISYVLIVPISVEKYLALTRPFWYNLHLFTKKVIGITIGLPTGVVLTTVTSLALENMVIYIVAQSTIIFVAYAVFLFCQIKVFMAVGRIKRRIHSEQSASRDKSMSAKNKRKSLSLSYIVLSFMLCYVPWTLDELYNYVNGHNQVFTK